jgi:hypothetical protein
VNGADLVRRVHFGRLGLTVYTTSEETKAMTSEELTPLEQMIADGRESPVPTSSVCLLKIEKHRLIRKGSHPRSSSG